MRNLLGCLIALLVLSGCGNSLMSEKQFTEFCADKIQLAFPEDTCDVKDNLTLMVHRNGMELQHNLDNIYASYKANPKELETIIQDFIAASAEITGRDENINPDLIVPIIKSKEFLLEAMTATKGATLDSLQQVVEQYNSELYIVYAEDDQNSVEFFTKKNFAKLGISNDSLRNKSIRNLDALLPEVNLYEDSGHYMVTAGGFYESSLILFPKMWTTDNFKVDGDIVIAVPTRDLLFVTGSNDKKNLDKMRANAKEAYDSENYRISSELFRWNGTSFEIFR